MERTEGTARREKTAGTERPIPNVTTRVRTEWPTSTTRSSSGGIDKKCAPKHWLMDKAFCIPLCCVFVSRSGFWPSSFVVRCCGFDCALSSKYPPINWADDCTKGDGFQTQKRKGFMAGQVLFAKAVVIDGRKEWFCRFCSETHVWSRNRHSDGFAWEAFASSFHKKCAQLVCQVGHRRMTVKIVCWHTKLSGPEKHSCESCATM